MQVLCLTAFAYKITLIVDDLAHFLSALIRMERLKSFSIRRSKFNERKTEMIAAALLNCSLEKLNLSYCSLECTKFLETFFRANKTLRILDLRGNHISGKHLHGLSEGIAAFNGHLEYLNLARNPIGGEGLAKLLEKMCTANHVAELDLTGCCLEDSDVEYALDILGKHKHLHSLKVTCNPICGKNSVRLLELMRDNFKITELDIRGCSLSESDERELKLLLERNKYYQEYSFLMEDDLYEKTKRLETISNEK